MKLVQSNIQFLAPERAIFAPKCTYLFSFRGGGGVYRRIYGRKSQFTAPLARRRKIEFEHSYPQKIVLSSLNETRQLKQNTNMPMWCVYVIKGCF